MMQVCPVCNGRQKVPYDFYDLNIGSVSVTAPKTCRSCNGSGIVPGTREQPRATTEMYTYNGSVPQHFGLSAIEDLDSQVRRWRQMAKEHPAKHMKQDENGEWVPVGEE